MMWEIIKESILVCKNCDLERELKEVLSCPKCKETLLSLECDIKTKDERVIL